MPRVATDRRERIAVVVLGGRGELARRKLLPALARISREAEREGREIVVVASGRAEQSDAAYRAETEELLGRDGALFARSVFYRSADVRDPHSVEGLAREIDAIAGPKCTGRLFYLALSPALFAPAVENLARARLLVARSGSAGAWSRLLVEKPFGQDLPSARRLNQLLHAHLHEEQIFRIDHFLAKETVQNLIGLRFHNTIFEPLWNRQHVEWVQITVAEDGGVTGGRGEYYDSAGALRDVVQNHMLQVLALIAMEPPASLDPEAVRDQKVQVLRALNRPAPEAAAGVSVRGQYHGALHSGIETLDYREEDGVARDSQTETYVAVRAELESWRWSGVPFFLRHGKRLPKRFTEVRVQFRMPPIQLFNRPAEMTDHEVRAGLADGSLCRVRPNALALRLQPDEEIALSFGVKEPGAAMRMTPASLAFDYAKHFGVRTADAYERLLFDALRGDPSLFLRADEVEAAWAWTDAVRAGWESPAAPGLLAYEAGTWGPREAEALLHGCCEGKWSNG